MTFDIMAVDVIYSPFTSLNPAPLCFTMPLVSGKGLVEPDVAAVHIWKDTVVEPVGPVCSSTSISQIATTVTGNVLEKEIS